LSPDRILTIGLAVVLLAGLIIGGLGALHLRGLYGIAGIMGPMILYVFAIGMILPNSTAAAMEPLPHMAGVASSLIGCLQMAGGAVTGYVSSTYYDGTSTAMTLTVSSMAGLSFGLYHLVARRREAAPLPTFPKETPGATALPPEVPAATALPEEVPDLSPSAASSERR
jgi:DHA1 family bicyclomycin/chloramphenicol resistance-like MFS transporter